MSFTQRKIGSIESLEQRRFMAADTFEALLPQVEPEPMINVSLSGLKDDAIQADGYEIHGFILTDWNVVGGELKDSGETLVSTDPEVQDFAFDEMGKTDGKPFCYLAYKLDRAFVKSWSISGDADDRPTEDVAFYYNKIAFNYASTSDGREF